ncbi:esterase-like activity of phytase family protein [Croceibacterium sp. TMG7-5b_MA50]|uniref:esterase-like activity of phytase family protein n=1 Tax=Croceibacterium sp. TMG7-5b_MA50 TaxID=3121290 RepID=UPI00322162CA
MRARRRRWLRLVPLALLCLLLAPGTWWRTPDLPPGVPATLSITPLKLAQPDDWPAALRLVGGWVLRSDHARFGGYSALVPLPGGRLQAWSDRGDYLLFRRPDHGRGRALLGTLQRDADARYWSDDLEAATRDPVTNRQWLTIESTNAIRRLDSHGRPAGGSRPRAMRDWPTNKGGEAMVRLPDGRFIVLGEGVNDGSPPISPGVLFAGDPVDGASAIRFGFPRQGRLHPTDMALLPDGRALILQRQIEPGLPPFGAMLAIADPAAIRANKPWPWQTLAQLAPPLPRENYEGLAVTPAPDGGVHLWIISDDNQSGVQRTLLWQLHLVI